ncbi:MAG TPA: chloride channel protein [Pirellulaceae bacterium]|nr:chloride channel protein [Pirellulaceae bacterium]
MPAEQSPVAVGEAIPISPALSFLQHATQAPAPNTLVDGRVLRICGLAIVLGVLSAFIAQLLVALINLITNLSFFGVYSLREVAPAENELGLWVIAVPVVGALLIGFMARYGSKAIRGHGIPEAMEQVLTNKSRIPARVTILKPLSAAISIGTGGPFGAEGPIIATGGALGSLLGQLLPTTPVERKTLLAAGAAAGMTAIFGTPVSALLLAIELLLFEFRPRSLIPVALAVATAASLRLALVGSEPVFSMPAIVAPSLAALLVYLVLGGLLGVVAKGVTHAVYAIEDAFEKLPIHWMWWPAIGAVVVGVVGYFAPRTLGVGYNNITDLLQGKLALQAIVFLCTMKFVSWSIALGSGTSGGTLAPLLTVGGGLGAVVGLTLEHYAPQLGVDSGLAALVGMAALFAGATRAPMASAVFAFEMTMQPLALLPLLTSCVASYLVSCRTMPNTIMTEKIARRGIRTPGEYIADDLQMVLVRDVATKAVVSIAAHDTVAKVRAWLASDAPEAQHQGYPVLNASGVLVGVITARDLRGEKIDPSATVESLVGPMVKYVYDDCSVRQAADHLVNHNIGRLPVVLRSQPQTVIGILTRSDVLAAHRRVISDGEQEAPTIHLRRSKK